MSIEPNTESRAGRMLDALLRSKNRNAKVVLTIAVSDAAGKRRMHETFAVKKWESQDRTQRRLFVSIPSTADWNNGVRPLTPLTLDLETGEIKSTRDPRMTPLLGWAARAVWRYVAEGADPAPANGSAAIVEKSICGACGLPLTDDVSIRLGYGPDCEKRLFGKKTRRSKAMTSESRSRRSRTAA